MRILRLIAAVLIIVGLGYGGYHYAKQRGATLSASVYATAPQQLDSTGLIPALGEALEPNTVLYLPNGTMVDPYERGGDHPHVGPSDIGTGLYVIEGMGDSPSPEAVAHVLGDAGFDIGERSITLPHNAPYLVAIALMLTGVVLGLFAIFGAKRRVRG